MNSPDRLFGNQFSDRVITATRLANFAQDTLNKLIAANPVVQSAATATPAVADSLQDIIDRITPALADLQTQLGDVDTAITQQRGATLTNDQVRTAFINTMRTKEGVIADAVGGYGSANFLQFYPQGLTEYTTATKPQMTTLVGRVKTAAIDFATQLGSPLATLLQSYAAAWQESRDTQQQKIGTVEDNRTERTQAEIDTELALTFAVHAIGAMYPGDVQQCSSFFDFSLLLPHVRHQTEKFSGNVAKNTTTIVLNRSFTENDKLKFTTVADNASLLVYLGAAADAQPNGSGIEVKATKSRNLKLNKLGGEGGTFLLVKNLSAVNDAAYLLEVKS